MRKKQRSRPCLSPISNNATTPCQPWERLTFNTLPPKNEISPPKHPFFNKKTLTTMKTLRNEYATFLSDLKSKIRQAQYEAMKPPLAHSVQQQSKKHEKKRKNRQTTRHFTSTAQSIVARWRNVRKPLRTRNARAYCVLDGRHEKGQKRFCFRRYRKQWSCGYGGHHQRRRTAHQ